MSTPRRRVVLVGIGGSSASGKSTLAAGLAKELNSPLKVFSADHYLDIHRVRQAGSWETPAGIAWDDMRAALENTVNTLAQCDCLPPSLVVGGFSRGPLELVPSGQARKQLGSEPVVVIIEGFLLFSDKKTCDMLDMALWIETDGETCGRRRWNREGRRGTEEKYMVRFHEQVWSYYERYRGEQLGNVPKVQHLDGALEPQNIIMQAVTHCKEAIQCRSKNAIVSAADDREVEAPSEEAATPVRRRVILLGIGGSSASGKSTLAAGLAKELNSPLKVFSADHYLDFNRVRRVGSWETPAGIAWEDLRLALQNTVGTLAQCERLPSSLVVGGFSRGPLELVPRGQACKLLGLEPVVVIVEGFLLFHDKKVCDMCDLTLWLGSDCETCGRRRYMREGKPGDFKDYMEDFREDVWHHHELYRGEQLANVPNVLCLSSVLESQELISAAAAHCNVVMKAGNEAVESTPGKSAPPAEAGPGCVTVVISETTEKKAEALQTTSSPITARTSSPQWLIGLCRIIGSLFQWLNFPGKILASLREARS